VVVFSEMLYLFVPTRKSTVREALVIVGDTLQAFNQRSHATLRGGVVVSVDVESLQSLVWGELVEIARVTCDLFQESVTSPVMLSPHAKAATLLGIETDLRFPE
jgi:hypothetical protein